MRSLGGGGRVSALVAMMGTLIGVGCGVVAGTREAQFPAEGGGAGAMVQSAPDSGPLARELVPDPALELAANTAKDLGVFTCNQPADKPAGCTQVTDYSGLVYDPFHHRMLMFGGGHGGAPAIATTIYSFSPSTLTWSALYPSTLYRDMVAANLDTEKGAWINTQQPVVRHTYDMLVVADVGGSKQFIMLTNGGIGGGVDVVGIPSRARIAHYDLARTDGRWTFSKSSAGAWEYYAASAYDPPSRKIIVIGPGPNAGYPGMWVYDPVAQTVQAGATLPPNVAAAIGHGENMVYFPPNQKLYYLRGGSPVRVFEVTLNRRNWRASTVTELSSARGVASTRETGWAYDATSRIIGGGVTDGIFYAYDPLTRSWTSRTMQSTAGAIGTVAFHALDYDNINNVFVFIANGPAGRRTWAYRYAATPS